MSVALVRRSECVPKKLGSIPMLAIHWQTNRAYCRVVIGRSRPRPLKRDSAGLLPGSFDVTVHRLTVLLCHLKPDGLAGLLLAHARPVDCVTMRSNVLDLQADDVASAELAIDG